MRNIIVCSASLLVVVGVAGCERKPTEPGNIPGGAETGMLRVLIGSETLGSQIDPRVEEVWVRIDSVEARHASEGWVSVSTERQDLDLLAQARAGGGEDAGGPGDADDLGPEDEDGVDPGPLGGMAGFEQIGDGEVWTGSYDRLHLGIADTWIVVDGEQQDLEFLGNIDPLDPFDAGLTINEPFFVDADTFTTVQISWNLGQNLDERDNGEWFLGSETSIRVDIEAEGGGGDLAGGGGAGGGPDY